MTYIETTYTSFFSQSLILTSYVLIMCWILLVPVKRLIAQKTTLKFIEQIIFLVSVPILIVEGGPRLLRSYDGETSITHQNAYRVETKCFWSIFNENKCHIIPMQPHHYQPDWDGSVSFGSIDVMETWGVSAEGVECILFVDSEGARRHTKHISVNLVEPDECVDQTWTPETRTWKLGIAKGFGIGAIISAIVWGVRLLLHRRSNESGSNQVGYIESHEERHAKVGSVTIVVGNFWGSRTFLENQIRKIEKRGHTWKSWSRTQFVQPFLATSAQIRHALIAGDKNHILDTGIDVRVFFETTDHVEKLQQWVTYAHNNSWKEQGINLIVMFVGTSDDLEDMAERLAPLCDSLLYVENENLQIYETHQSQIIGEK